MKRVLLVLLMGVFISCSSSTTDDQKNDLKSGDAFSSDSGVSKNPQEGDAIVDEKFDNQEVKNDQFSSSEDSNFYDASKKDSNSGPKSDVTYGTTCSENCGYGNIKGLVCAPNEQVFVNNAKVYVDAIDCDGNPVHIETYSDTDGSYLLENVPCGEQTVHVEKGSFSNWYVVSVKTGETVDVSGQGKKMCFKATGTKMAVITGDWDNIEGLLSDLGFKPDIYELYNDWGMDEGDWTNSQAHQFLTNLSKMEEYDIIFIDCGAAHQDMVKSNPEIISNIQEFVKNGGSLYASDWAYIYIELAFPEAINFYGEQTNSGPIAMSGNQVVSSTILDPYLVAYFGGKNLDVYYGLGPLVAVDSAEYATVHVEGFVKQFNKVQPSILSYTPYNTGGTVIYTNFHNDEQATADMLKILYYLVFIL